MNSYIIKVCGSYKWLMLMPETNKNNLHVALTKIRGEILYNNGERPEFLHKDQMAIDDDNLDKDSYHLIQCFEDETVGGMRLTPIKNDLYSQSVLFDFIGQHSMNSIFNHFSNKKLFEATRLFIKKNYRTRKNIINIYAGLWFIGQYIDKSSIVLSSPGVKAGHDRFLININGAKTLPFLPDLIYSEKYNDSIRIVYFDVSIAPQKLEKYIAEFRLL